MPNAPPNIKYRGEGAVQYSGETTERLVLGVWCFGSAKQRFYGGYERKWKKQWNLLYSLGHVQTLHTLSDGNIDRMQHSTMSSRSTCFLPLVLFDQKACNNLRSSLLNPLQGLLLWFAPDRIKRGEEPQLN